MTIKDHDMGLPVVTHIVRVDNQAGPFYAAACAKEPGRVFRYFGIQGVAGKMKFTFGDERMTVSPNLQGIGVYPAGVCCDGKVLTFYADIACQGIETGFFVITAVVGTGHRFVFAFGHIGVDGVSAAQTGCRAEGEHTDQHSQHEQGYAHIVHIIHSLSDCLLLFYRKIVCLAKFVQIGYTILRKNKKTEVARG